MAVFKKKCGNYKIKINDQDHEPPHCHVNIEGRNKRISLLTLEILNPPPHHVPAALRKCLARRQEEMLNAWEKVEVVKF